LHDIEALKNFLLSHRDLKSLSLHLDRAVGCGVGLRTYRSFELASAVIL
jgi:hypothetical protein